ncbi:MAG: phosphatidylserine decarboxylase [Chthoniobacterales bacterium]
MILAILLLVSLIWVPVLVPLWIVAILFTLYFFRDPERVPPDDDEVAVAAADGKVVGIDNLIEPEILRRRMIRVSIFLSVFDVHVNRAPIAGRILYSEPRKGKYYDARDERSGSDNVARMWVIEGKEHTVGVRQITGAVARRIVPWSQVDDVVVKGEKFGMIRFGSRTEIWLPEDSRVLVRVGQSVRGGVSAIAKLPTVSAVAGAVIEQDEADAAEDVPPSLEASST